MHTFKKLTFCEALHVAYAIMKSLCNTKNKLSSSKYCYHHAPRVSSGLHLGKAELDSDNEIPSTSSQEHEGIVQYIVSKKTTRGQTYYQVL